MRQSPLFTVIFPAIWLATGLAIVVGVPAVMHHAAGRHSWIDSMVYALILTVPAIAYSVWKSRRSRISQRAK